MQKLILQPDKYKQYEPIICEGETIWLLENFLHDIRVSSIPFYIDWVKDSMQTFLGYGNTTGLDKKNNMIVIDSAFSEQKDGGPFFTISIDQFVKLLKEWGKLVTAKTQKIIITEDNGIITIEGE